MCCFAWPLWVLFCPFPQSWNEKTCVVIATAAAKGRVEEATSGTRAQNGMSRASDVSQEAQEWQKKVEQATAGIVEAVEGT